MKILSSLTSYFRSFYEDRHEPERLRTLLNAYWRTLLLIVVLTIIAEIFYGAFVLIDVVTLVNSSGAEAVQVPEPVFSRLQLEAALAAFHDREAKFNALKTSSQTFSDPSK